MNDRQLALGNDRETQNPAYGPSDRKVRASARALRFGGRVAFAARPG